MSNSTFLFRFTTGFSPGYFIRMLFLTILLATTSTGAQAQGCGTLTPSFIEYEPCKYRLQISNLSECVPPLMTLVVDQGTILNFSANSGAGYAVQPQGPGVYQITYNGPFIPLGTSFPMIFTVPPGDPFSVSLTWEFTCGLGEGCFFGPISLEVCPDPMDASVIGTKYRECNGTPYSNQPALPGWTIQLYNDAGELFREDVTDNTGEYRFFDLPKGNYIIKEIAAPGWTPNVPASGEYLIDLAASQQVVRNFGNCPSCSCDSVSILVNQASGTTSSGTYCISLLNSDAYCFPAVNLNVGAGQLNGWNLSTGWTAQPVNSQEVNFIPPGGFVPLGASSPGCFNISGAGAQSFNVNTTYGTAPNQVVCGKSFNFIVPPPPPIDTDCCPMGSIPGPELVVNGDFNVTNPANIGFGFITDYAYVFPPGNPMSNGNNAILDQNQAYAVNNQWICPGITGPGDTYLAVDGHTMAGKAAWKAQVIVTPGTQYDFCAFARNLVRNDRNYDDPVVQLWVKDGTNPAVMVDQMALPENLNSWQKLNATVTPTSGTMILEIRSGITSGLGNDFAVDKVSFLNCAPANVCTCDSIQLSLQQIGNFIDVCCYRVDVVNASSHCFPEINVQVDAGLFITTTTPLSPWIVTPQGQQGLLLTHPSGSIPAGVYAPLEFCVAGGSVHNLFVVTHYTDPAGNRVDCDRFETFYCLASDTCTCKPSTVYINHDGGTSTVSCNTNFLPVIPCPTNPVNISSDFGCVDALGNPCNTNGVVWTLDGPNGFIQQGAFSPNNPLNWSFPAATFLTQGTYTLRMTTLCQGQTDSCVCRVSWKVECDTCSCDDNAWAMEIRFGGAQNQPVHCGDVVQVPPSGFFVFYPSFMCQGPPNCMPALVNWQLNGPNLLTGGALLATPTFTIPPLSPANFTTPGMYTLQMWGICGTDTCHCHVTFCVPPPAPIINDTSICRTLSSAYIPLQGCPTDCDIVQVQWFVKPCSATTWPTTPYQVSGAGPLSNCSDLLLLPYKYPGEACVQVYAVIDLAPGCCVAQLTSNIATITLCDPISCSISNPNTPACDVLANPQAMTVSLTGANCNYTVEWIDYNGNPVSTQLSYTPPQLAFPTNSSACFIDYTYTAVIKGICGTSTCTTTIRVYNSSANNGDLTMDPPEPQPFCPGEDATIKFTPHCTGPTSTWGWQSSTTSGTGGFGPIQGSGNMNTVWNTNQLYQTTWYMVTSQNGPCPAQNDVFQIVVKNSLSIVNFTATPDPCVDSYVNLSVDFTPAQATTGCQYTVEWYYNGNLIHTSVSPSSPVSYSFANPNPGNSMAGVYYAIVKDNCCPGAEKTWPIILDPTCWPVITGPCFICGYGPATLMGHMVLPPQDPCPDISGCTFQWYEWINNVLTPIPGATGLTYTTNHGGDYVFESNCGGCIRQDDHHVEQCGGTDCVTDVNDLKLPINFDAQIYPNPTAGQFTLELAPEALKHGRVEIVRLDGQILLTDQLAAAQTKHIISADRLPPGLYFIRVFEGEFLLWTGKIVKSE